MRDFRGWVVPVHGTLERAVYDLMCDHQSAKVIRWRLGLRVAQANQIVHWIRSGIEALTDAQKASRIDELLAWFEANGCLGITEATHAMNPQFASLPRE